MHQYIKGLAFRALCPAYSKFSYIRITTRKSGMPQSNTRYMSSLTYDIFFKSSQLVFYFKQFKLFRNALLSGSSYQSTQ